MDSEQELEGQDLEAGAPAPGPSESVPRSNRYRPSWRVIILSLIVLVLALLVWPAQMTIAWVDDGPHTQPGGVPVVELNPHQRLVFGIGRHSPPKPSGNPALCSPDAFDPILYRGIAFGIPRQYWAKRGGRCGIESEQPRWSWSLQLDR